MAANLHGSLIGEWMRMKMYARLVRRDTREELFEGVPMTSI